MTTWCCTSRTSWPFKLDGSFSVFLCGSRFQNCTQRKKLWEAYLDFETMHVGMTDLWAAIDLTTANYDLRNCSTALGNSFTRETRSKTRFWTEGENADFALGRRARTAGCQRRSSGFNRNLQGIVWSGSQKKSNLFFPDKKMTTNKDFENTFFPFLLLSSFLPLLPGYLGLCTRSTLRFFVIFLLKMK